MTLSSHGLKGFFITGSDTGIGKTWIGSRIVQQLKASGACVKVRKPVESGCRKDASGALISEDGTLLSRANGELENIDIVTPYRFGAALAPDRAATLQDISLSIDDLVRAVRNQLNAGESVVVEGAGGFCSPIANDGLNADLARRLELPVIIVVEDRLGAINQAILTLRAVRQESLCIAAIILNQVQEQIEGNGLDNLSDLKKRVTVPVYRCAHYGELPAIDLRMQVYS